MKKFALALAVVVSLGLLSGSARADHRSYSRHGPSCHSHYSHHHDCYPYRPPVVRYYEPAPYYVSPSYRYYRDDCHYGPRVGVGVAVPGVSFYYGR